jgi:hypothetical protein
VSRPQFSACKSSPENQHGARHLVLGQGVGRPFVLQACVTHWRPLQNSLLALPGRAPATSYAACAETLETAGVADSYRAKRRKVS